MTYFRRKLKPIRGMYKWKLALSQNVTYNTSAATYCEII